MRFKVSLRSAIVDPKQGCASPNRSPTKNARQEVVVDGGGCESRPKSADGMPAIEARHQTNFGLLQGSDDVSDVIAINTHVAVAENDDVVLCERKHTENI